MFPFKWKKIAVTLDAEVKGRLPEQNIVKCAIDSRKVKAGELFFALKGENFDAHQFVEDVFKKGAVGAVVEKILPHWDKDFPLLIVKDTLKALQSLAAKNRLRSKAPVIAVTGSSGKTSTKDLIFAVLSQEKNTLKTLGNYNNEVGLPLTLLDIEEKHEAIVVEMGMRGLGQIKALCEIARPNIGVITNIGKAHLELLKSVENIARAKGELLDFIPSEGFALVHGDSPFISNEVRKCKGKVLFFGQGNNFDIYPKEIISRDKGNSFKVATPRGEFEAFLPLLGRHNIINSLAAIGIGLELGISIAKIVKGLSSVELSKMRLEIIEKKGISFINDAYNANFDSMKVGLEVLEDVAQNKKRKIAVLGDMLELGENTSEEHSNIGVFVASKKVDYLVTVGNLALHIANGAQKAGLEESKIKSYNNLDEAIEDLRGYLKEGDVLLAKGSRAMQMEKIVEQLSIIS